MVIDILLGGRDINKTEAAETILINKSIPVEELETINNPAHFKGKRLGLPALWSQAGRTSDSYSALLALPLP